MTYDQALKQAQKIADKAQYPVLVYRAKHNTERELAYGTAFTQPSFAASIIRVYPKTLQGLRITVS